MKRTEAFEKYNSSKYTENKLIMKEKALTLKSKRLKIYPLPDDEIQKMIDDCNDDGLRAAYSEMLDSCRNDPGMRQWYAPWAMELKDEKKRIGTLGFRGPAVNNSVEIGYGIDSDYEGLGYTTEAAQALTDWAFSNEDVLFVEAEADENNAASIRVLEKLGFTRYGQGEEGPRFVKETSGTSYTALGISLGLCLGPAIGMLIFDNMSLGMCTGLALGAALGASKDSRERSRISSLKKERYGIESDPD